MGIYEYYKEAAFWSGIPNSWRKTRSKYFEFVVNDALLSKPCLTPESFSDEDFHGSTTVVLFDWVGMVWFFGHVKYYRLFSSKSIFIHKNSSIFNNSVFHS